ncbi:hypothetical protein PROFUN_04325 [Planoprotostelium fungivorum]|uniref:Uncharacterized protein n=1 Tax=Planoprotostelium fungivorum TaxID=1890364 RepID=A0A2P6NV52_9EUKA|nr:hypothetical protein PROFUN_04325 [Planoprotostelium fungivorum]
MSDRSENATVNEHQKAREVTHKDRKRHLDRGISGSVTQERNRRLRSLFSQPHNEQAASTTYLPYYDYYHSHECPTYFPSASLLLSPTAKMKPIIFTLLIESSRCRKTMDERQEKVALLYLIKRQQSAFSLLSHESTRSKKDRGAICHCCGERETEADTVRLTDNSRCSVQTPLLPMSVQSRGNRTEPGVTGTSPLTGVSVSFSSERSGAMKVGECESRMKDMARRPRYSLWPSLSLSLYLLLWPSLSPGLQ